MFFKVAQPIDKTCIDNVCFNVDYREPERRRGTHCRLCRRETGCGQRAVRKRRRQKADMRVGAESQLDDEKVTERFAS